LLEIKLVGKLSFYERIGLVEVLDLEDNQEKLVATNQFTTLSQKFSEYGAFIGRGDSTKVFALKLDFYIEKMIVCKVGIF
jgi:hypothetical protein